MNINPILALLVLKGIVTAEEAEAVADFVHDKPQSTILGDVINQIKELLPMAQPLTGGPEQQNEELAARARLAEEEKQAAEQEAAEATDTSSEGTEKTENVPEDTPAEKPAKK